MDHRRVVEKTFESKLERRMGRPKLGWLKDVEKDLWEMKVKRWRQKAVDREESVSVIREAKALSQPYSQASKSVSKLSK
jgi:hypothetical protein